MTTLVSQRIGDGNERRCDAKCYDADGPDCTCLCGGMNHGQGLQAALDNTAELCRGLCREELVYMRGQGFELAPELAALLDSPQGELFAPTGARLAALTGQSAGEGACL